MATLTINTYGSNNLYDLDLTAFTDTTFGKATFAKVTYVKSEDRYGSEPNVVTFHQVPTSTEIQNCLQTNINRIQELTEKAIKNDDEEDYYDHIPDYVIELLFFMQGLHENNLLTLEQGISYVKQLQKLELDAFTSDFLEEFLGQN